MPAFAIAFRFIVVSHCVSAVLIAIGLRAERAASRCRGRRSSRRPPAAEQRKKTDKDDSADRGQRRSRYRAEAADSKKDAEATRQKTEAEKPKDKDKREARRHPADVQSPKPAKTASRRRNRPPKAKRPKAPKREKVRLAMLTLKRLAARNGRPGRSVRREQARPARSDQAAGEGGQGQVGRRRRARYSESDDRPRQGRRAARRDQPLPRDRQEGVRDARIGRCRPTTWSPAPAMKSSCPKRASLMLPGIHAEATFYKGLLGKGRRRGRFHPHRRLQGRRRADDARQIQRAGPREHDVARSTACTTKWSRRSSRIGRSRSPRPRKSSTPA